MNCVTPDEATLNVLQEIVRRYGTPTYAFDVARLRAQIEKLRQSLPDAVDVLYSLKANASLGICDVFADCGIGADVASAGELATAIAAGFPPERIFVAGPFKTPETITLLRETPGAVVSADSLSELQWLSESRLTNPVALRLRPDFGSCAVVPAGSESRFGFTCDDLNRCRELLPSCDLDVIGFHVFAGSQVLDVDRINEHLRRALELSLRAADTLEIQPALINLGGGFGIPYGPHDKEFDLPGVGDELSRLAARAAPARLVLELGRYLVAQAGWYLTSVLGRQSFQGRAAVVVDGGVHQRADLCGLRLRNNQHPPVVLDARPLEKGLEKGSGTDCAKHPKGRSGNRFLTPFPTLLEHEPRRPTSVLGCLSLPDDVMIEDAMLPELSRGDVLAFANAGAYGLWSSPALFHGSPLPAEIAFEGSTIHLMRARQAAHSVLRDQRHVLKSFRQKDR